jgi:hypothetical protein
MNQMRQYQVMQEKGNEESLQPKQPLVYSIHGGASQGGRQGLSSQQQPQTNWRSPVYNLCRVLPDYSHSGPNIHTHDSPQSRALSVLNRQEGNARRRSIGVEDYSQKENIQDLAQALMVRDDVQGTFKWHI